MADHKIVYIVPDSERITSDIIQLSEMTEAVGIRASQIERGSRIFTNYDGLTDPIQIAKKEFLDRKNPLILERPVKETVKEIYVEHWKVRKMAFPIENRKKLNTI